MSTDRELLIEAQALLNDMWKRLLAVKPWLDKPYPDCPESSPWAHGIERRTRRAHDLDLKICKHLAHAGHDVCPSCGRSRDCGGCRDCDGQHKITCEHR